MDALARKSSLTLLRSHANPPSGFIRGGRLRKTSKSLISFAPFPAGASVLALGALLATSSPAGAGNCTETGTTGVWTCSGPASGSGRDSGQTIRGRANQDIDVTGDATFGLSTAYLQTFGIRTQSVATTGAIDVNLSNNNRISSYSTAISINQVGTGAVTVHTNGTVTSDDFVGIDIDQNGNGDVTVTTDGPVGGTGGAGIDIVTAAGTTGEVNVTANAAVTSYAESISLDVNGNNAVTVMASGAVTSHVGEEAIEIQHSGTGDVDLTTVGTMTSNEGSAILVNHSGTGNITLTVNGSVVAGSSANAIDLSTASGNASIILGTDASLTRDIDVSGVTGTASLEIGGTGDRSFNIGGIPAINGNPNFDKNGDYTLTVAGTHASGASFEQTNINEGKLVWGGTDFRTASLAIADGAALEITGGSSFTDTSVTLSGRLELTGNGSNITVESLAGNGGIDIDVDFSGGDAELANARLTAASVTGTIPVNIRSVNAFRVPGNDEDDAVTLENFLAVANSGAFEAGNVLDNGNFNFQLVYDSAAGRWNLVARPTQSAGEPGSGGPGNGGPGGGGGNGNGGETVAGGIGAALYESLPSALAQLASLESYRQRLQDRQHGGNDNVWAKVSGFSAGFEPVATTLATYEIENAAAAFGIDVPLHANHPRTSYNFTVGASAAFGEATTDVAVGTSTGEIATTTFKASASANWEYDGIYVDGQLQYAIFGNKVKSDTKLASEAATAYSAGLEIGYGFDIGGFRMTPSAQLTWTSIDFDDFKDSATMEVVLEDGAVLAGRAGIGVEKAFPFAGILLRGHANLLMPLDGEVTTRTDGTELTSEREDPVFDAGMGATYAWNDSYALSVDFSTRQGGEEEGYAGSIRFKYKF